MVSSNWKKVYLFEAAKAKTINNRVVAEMSKPRLRLKPANLEIMSPSFIKNLMSACNLIWPLAKRQLFLNDLGFFKAWKFVTWPLFIKNKASVQGWLNYFGIFPAMIGTFCDRSCPGKVRPFLFEQKEPSRIKKFPYETPAIRLTSFNDVKNSKKD